MIRPGCWRRISRAAATISRPAASTASSSCIAPPRPTVAGRSARMEITAENFKQNARHALDDPQLQRALINVRHHFIDKRAEAAAALPEFETLREQARAIKDHTLAHLD